MVDSPRVGGARPGESRKPGSNNSFGRAHAPEQRAHVGPEPLPPLTFLIRQPGECVLGADAGQVRIAAPKSQPVPDPGVDLRIAVVEPLATPGQFLEEPVEGACLRRTARSLSSNWSACNRSRVEDDNRTGERRAEKLLLGCVGRSDRRALRSGPWHNPMG